MEDEVWVIRMKPGGMGVDWGVVVMPMVVETNPCMVWLGLEEEVLWEVGAMIESMAMMASMV
ncbi:hypothetical protein JHK84_036895 [Glycine max]|nr:hypothetical protein JHK87_036402 [Glycine soja]KAG5130498.1 hypothetical protein JHK84_036895 [Glycine max]